MSAAIQTEALSKEYRSPIKEEGLRGGLKALFSRRYRDVRAVDAVNISINEGELVGFLGANGAGKTTTLKMLSGLLTPTSGNAMVLGHVPWKRESDFQKKISLVMGQRTQLWWEIPALETYRLNQAIYEIPETDFLQHLDELVDLLELKDYLSIPVKKLSLGQRMRAEMVAALLHQPKLLLLDEPTIGLDVIMQKKVRDFIKTYNQRYNATIMLTSHNMTDVVELCKRVIVIDKGHILYDGALNKLIERYADHKIVRVHFKSPINESLVSNLGKVISNENNVLTLQIPRSTVAAATGELLRSYSISDLDVNEVDIDDIVRQLFSHT